MTIEIASQRSSIGSDQSPTYSKWWHRFIVCGWSQRIRPRSKRQTFNNSSTNSSSCLSSVVITSPHRQENVYKPYTPSSQPHMSSTTVRTAYSSDVQEITDENIDNILGLNPCMDTRTLKEMI